MTYHQGDISGAVAAALAASALLFCPILAGITGEAFQQDTETQNIEFSGSRPTNTVDPSTQNEDVNTTTKKKREEAQKAEQERQRTEQERIRKEEEERARIQEEERIRKEEEERARLQEEERIRRMDSIHFCQNGNYTPYWGDTIASSGCGLVAYTIAIDMLTGESYSPEDMLSKRGDWMGMESWPDDRTGTDGRTHSEFTSDEFNIDYFLIDCSVERLYESLDGRSVAIVLSSGPFLPQWWYCNGHFVVVYKQQDGLFFVQDPASDTPNTIYNEDEMRQLLSNSPRTLLLKRR